MGIKKRTTPAEEAAMAAFAAGADHVVAPVEESAVTVNEVVPAQPRVAQRLPAAVKVLSTLEEAYADLLATYSALGVEAPTLESLPESTLVRHSGVKEEALLAHLLAQLPDPVTGQARSKSAITRAALVRGLRAMAEDAQR